MGAHSGFPKARRLAIVAMLAALAALCVMPASASAADATVKGTFAGPGLPDAGDGVTVVRAIDAETGVIDGADFTGGKRDRWRLNVPPAPYVLGATAVPFEGGKLIERLVAFVDADSGDTETLKLRLKPKRHHRSRAPHPAARGGSGIGDVEVDFPAIWVKDVDVQSSSPEMQLLRKGMRDMLITDLSAAIGGPDCPGAIVERGRINEVISEIKRQQLPGFDPGTRVRTGKLYIDNASVSSNLTESGGHVVITSTYTDRRTGRSRTVTVQGPDDNIFDLESQLAKKLIEAICADDLPASYAGSFSGSSVNADATTSWNGTLTWERAQPPYTTTGADCNSRDAACYEIAGGSVTWQVSTTPGAQCTYDSPPKTVTIPRDSPGVLYVQRDGGDTPGYGGGFGIFDRTEEGTSQCDPSDPPENEIYYMNDCCMTTNPGMPWGDFGENGGFTLRGTSSSDNGVIKVTRTWNFSGQ